MYAKSVSGVACRRTEDGDRMNPQYVEWLMGYPLDHTKIA